jgi:hypothetical protein
MMHINDSKSYTSDVPITKDISGANKPTTWSIRAAEVEWKDVIRKKKHAITVKGTRTVASTGAESTIKAVPRKERLYAYVGRLVIDTTEVKLSKYLADTGISNVKCRRLKEKDGVKYNSAAFFVSCDAESREQFYNESNWPDGAELRDWVFYN